MPGLDIQLPAWSSLIRYNKAYLFWLFVNFRHDAQINPKPSFLLRTPYKSLSFFVGSGEIARNGAGTGGYRAAPHRHPPPHIGRLPAT